MNEHLRRAVEAMESGASDVRALSTRSLVEARARLRRALSEAHEHLDDDEVAEAAAEDDVLSRLERQSQDIADELRRVERLMRDRTGRD